MNRKGLELLKTPEAPTGDLKKILDTKVFPPKFLNFLSLYGTGTYSFETIVLDDQVMDRFVLTAGEMYNEVPMHGELYTASIDHILPARKLLMELDKYNARAERWNQMGFVQIGLMGHDDVLLLGMEERNRDEIWRYGQGLTRTPCSKLEDDIFQLFKRFREVIDPDDLVGWNIRPEQIYKNFHEDFWRVRR
ncbi:MAG TPA: hypothetical protein VGK59_12035 [Ohtaekwangia sp.]